MRSVLFYHEMNHVFADAAPTEAKRMVREYNEAMSRNAIVSKEEASASARRVPGAAARSRAGPPRRGARRDLRPSDEDAQRRPGAYVCRAHVGKRQPTDAKKSNSFRVPSPARAPVSLEGRHEAILLYVSNSRYFSKRRKRTCDDLRDEIVSCKMNVPEWMQVDKSGTLFPVNLHRR